MVINRFYKKSTPLLTSILKLLNMKVNFEEGYASYSEEVDEEIRINFPSRVGKYFYKPIHVELPDYDIEWIEDLLNKDDSEASTMYPILYFIGYILVLDEGRWKIKKNG